MSLTTPPHKKGEQKRTAVNNETKVVEQVMTSSKLRKEILAQMKSINYPSLQEGVRAASQAKVKGATTQERKQTKAVTAQASPKTPRRKKTQSKQGLSGDVADLYPTSSLASLPPLKRFISRDWTEGEKRRLYAAVAQGNPTHSDFWRKVASKVGSGWNGADCQARYASLASTPPASKREKKARTRSPEELPSGKKAPMKRKRVLRRLMEARVKQEADDGFEDVAGEYDFSSIHSAKKLKKSFARVSTTEGPETDGELFQSVDREKLDSYLGKIKKNAKKSAKSRSKQPVSTGAAVSAIFLDMGNSETAVDEGDEGDEGDEADM